MCPILERRAAYAARMPHREAAARLAAIANLPIGWLLEDPSRDGEELVLRTTGPDGDEITVSALTAEQAWQAMAESLAAMGAGRLLR